MKEEVGTRISGMREFLGRRPHAALVFVVVMFTAGCGGSSPASSPTTTTSSSAFAAPHAVVTAYWNDIAAGDFRAAFLRFDGSEQKRSHGQQWFVNDKARDAPIRVRVRLGTAAVNRPFATVPIISLKTIGSLTGCHLWTGSYRLREIGSRWLIDAANLVKHSC